MDGQLLRDGQIGLTAGGGQQDTTAQGDLLRRAKGRGLF